MKRLSLNLLIPPLFIISLLLFFYFSKKEAPLPALPARPQLSSLAAAPDWSRLDPYQHLITREDFEELLTKVFIWEQNSQWNKLITLTDEACHIRKKNNPDCHDHYTLHFKSTNPHSTPTPSSLPRSLPRYWRPSSQLPPTYAERPLSDLHVAIDPGHIGGDFAKIEERYFQIGKALPIMEGELTLTVAHLIKDGLEELGADVTLVRKQNSPVTEKRTSDFKALARENLQSTKRLPLASTTQKLAEKLFYRTAEIRARGKLVNESIRPDLVLCLHFNAEAWGNPHSPTLTENNHLHLLLHGSYMDGEIAHDDERFQMIYKLIQGIHQEEKALSIAVADSFAEQSGLPAYTYSKEKPAMNIDGHPYLWARNLLANRLYECPVIFLEPYVMNSQEVHDRVQLGDYLGTKELNGIARPSIFREYAHSVIEGLKAYYLQNRTIIDNALP